jgi:hypothetical protein
LLSAGDVKTLASTRKARALVALPPEYVAGETVKLVVSAGVKTTVASTSVTVDFQAYTTDRDGAVDGSDLVATAATSINSLTLGDYEFTVTSTSLSPGDTLDILLSIAYSDSGTVTAVTPVATVDLLCDIKG